MAKNKDESKKSGSTTILDNIESPEESPVKILDFPEAQEDGRIKIKDEYGYEYLVHEDTIKEIKSICEENQLPISFVTDLYRQFEVENVIAYLSTRTAMNVMGTLMEQHKGLSGQEASGQALLLMPNTMMMATKIYEQSRKDYRDGFGFDFSKDK